MNDEPTEEQLVQKKTWLAVRDAARAIGINPHAALAIFRGPDTAINMSWDEKMAHQRHMYAQVTEQIFKKLDSLSPEQLKSAQFLGVTLAEELKRGFQKIVAASQPGGSMEIR